MADLDPAHIDKATEQVVNELGLIWPDECEPVHVYVAQAVLEAVADDLRAEAWDEGVRQQWAASERVQFNPYRERASRPGGAVVSTIDPAYIADRFTPACPTCGHGSHRHLQTKPGCRDCPGHQGYNRPGQCAETRASATGKALLAVLEAVTPAIEANALREAVRLLEYALNLRMYGDGHGEKQSDWDQQCEAYLRSLPMELRYQRADQISPKENHDA